MISLLFIVIRPLSREPKPVPCIVIVSPIRGLAGVMELITPAASAFEIRCVAVNIGEYFTSSIDTIMSSRTNDSKGRIFYQGFITFILGLIVGVGFF